jgi:hypothetical protein
VFVNIIKHTNKHRKYSIGFVLNMSILSIKARIIDNIHAIRILVYAFSKRKCTIMLLYILLIFVFLKVRFPHHNIWTHRRYKIEHPEVHTNERYNRNFYNITHTSFFSWFLRPCNPSKKANSQRYYCCNDKRVHFWFLDI